ncbi:MAG: preprotein translocase subunit YajC [Candidatus Aminicenantes bacterium]|nr:MAG: preprotein translocase subunit YajC [Candidatus Aminicenantes bacterium]TET69429.1 MAG: preprotein translocase subunit YajC [Candidatus Aminicenantes bacterium]
MILAFFGFIQQAEPTPRPGGGMIQMLFMFGLIFAIFYFLIIRPQRTKQKKHQEMVEQLKPGNKIITTGGIYGTVMGVQKDRIELKVASNVKIDILKTAVGVVLSSKKEKK